MRPAQKAPENVERTNPSVRNPRRFNEAGAKSAGKHSASMPARPGASRFNEAGAKSAGKRNFCCNDISKNQRASMRPAQKAPENPGCWAAMRLIPARFNEAGAKSAGKLFRCHP